MADKFSASAAIQAVRDWVASKIATSSDYGMVKLNPNEAVTLNSDGQLDVGGRLGAFSGTTGIFHSKDREPRSVKDFSDNRRQGHEPRRAEGLRACHGR